MQCFTGYITKCHRKDETLPAVALEIILQVGESRDGYFGEILQLKTPRDMMPVGESTHYNAPIAGTSVLGGLQFQFLVTVSPYKHFVTFYGYFCSQF